MITYVVEYDENGVVWLIDTSGRTARIALQHGSIVHIDIVKAPVYDEITQSSSACE